MTLTLSNLALLVLGVFIGVLLTSLLNMARDPYDDSEIDTGYLDTDIHAGLNDE